MLNPKGRCLDLGGKMTRTLLRVCLVFALLIAPSVSGSSGWTPPLPPAVHLSVGCPGSAPPFRCTFVASTTSPLVIFFRYDLMNRSGSLGGDGLWDFPNQAGAPRTGRWSTLTTVDWWYDLPPSGPACAQGWNGLSTRRSPTGLVPLGPVGCTGFLSVIPHHWWRGSPDRFVLGKLEIPPWLDRADFNPRVAELEGVPAVVLPYPDPALFLFLVDRAELTAKLGVGTHPVHLTLLWAGATFTGLDTVRID